MKTLSWLLLHAVNAFDKWYLNDNSHIERKKKQTNEDKLNYYYVSPYTMELLHFIYLRKLRKYVSNISKT